MNSRPIKIAIDAVGIDEPGGGRTATLYLLDNLFDIHPNWQYVIYVSQKEPSFYRYPNVQQIQLPVTKGIFARAVVQLVFFYVSLKKKADLVHFMKSQGAFLFGVKNILTIFDVTTLRLPHIHNPLAVWYWRNIQPIIARKCDVVVTITSDAAKDIHELLHVPENKIVVIPCASHIQPTNEPLSNDFIAIKSRYQLPDKYLLFVGALARKKNLSTLIAALGILQNKGIDFPPLVIVGPHYKLSNASGIFSEVTALSLEHNVSYIGVVPESSLLQIYLHAELFLLSSLHEGFGIPALEAMACSIPIIASKTSAITEVVGDAGWLVDDYMSPQSWAESIEILLNNPELRAQFITKGRQRVQDFSWVKSAQQLVSLYEHVLDLH